MMTNPAKQKAQMAFEMFFNNKEQLRMMYNNERLVVDKETLFLIGHLLSNTIDDVDLEMHSLKINQYYKMFTDLVEENKPIHGNFFNELRQRYFDLLNCTPIENAEEPLTDNHLAWMLTELSSDAMSETKKHRWLGYIQGCMAFRGLLTVNEERDSTRKMFNGK